MSQQSAIATAPEAAKAGAVAFCDFFWALLFAVVGVILLARQVSMPVGLAMVLPGIAGLLLGIIQIRSAARWTYLAQSIVMLGIAAVVLLINIEARMFGLDQIRERLWDALAVLLSLLLAGLSFWEYIQRSTRSLRARPVAAGGQARAIRGNATIKCPHCPRSFSAPGPNNTCPHCGMKID
ncbi:MAG: hypothetical protein ACLFUJ_03100 [Phycisphaerae bacterium]